MEKLYGKDLAVMAYKARLLAVEAVHRASSGHPGGSLSCADALTTLYFNEMNVNPNDPKWDSSVSFLKAVPANCSTTAAAYTASAAKNRARRGIPPYLASPRGERGPAYAGRRGVRRANVPLSVTS